MALPHLIKFIYTHGTDEVIRRGKKIHSSGFIELLECDELFGSAVFRIKDDVYTTFYKVYIQKFKNPGEISLRCSCPYNLGDICRHESAALFRLQEMLDRGEINTEDVKYDQRHTVIKMKTIDLKVLRLMSSPESYQAAESFLRAQKAGIQMAENGTVKATVLLDEKEYTVLIRKNEEQYFDTSCDYEDEKHPLCLPKLIVFLQLLNTYGANYFDSIRNRDYEKNKLLEAYGYSLEDDLTGKFEFIYKEGKPFLRVLDPSIKKIQTPTEARPITEPFSSNLPKTESELPCENPSEKSASVSLCRLGIVLNLNQKNYPFFSFEAITGEWSESEQCFAGHVEKADLFKMNQLPELSDEDRPWLSVFRKMQHQEINKYVSRNSPFAAVWENIIHNDKELPEETKELISEYIYPKLKRIFSHFADTRLTYLLPRGKTFVTRHLKPLALRKQDASVYFRAKKESHFEIHCRIVAGHHEFSPAENQISSAMFFLHEGEAWLWHQHEVVRVLENFLPEGYLKIQPERWPETLHQFLIPLSANYKVVFDKSLIKEVVEGNPDVKLMLKEKGDYLVFEPVFSYKGYEIRQHAAQEIFIPYHDQVILIRRNKEKENEFLEKLKSLHSGFICREDEGTLALKGTEVLKNNWFFLFIDALREMKVPVFGFELLKNFRFNIHRPQTKIYINSHTDWFDAKVNISFGDQPVSVADVKKALSEKQPFVQLDDGTLGILPEEWIKKYALLFRIGEAKTQSLRLSRYHVSVIDELYDNIREDELIFRLEEKYENLRQFRKIKEIDPPEHLKQCLRPYQIAGFQWLNYLAEVGWGGILADDMGLGKTVQALSFLEHLRNLQGKLLALVVCPATLIYNWENEIKKFTPSLKYHIHHGPARTNLKDDLEQQELIITTYGTLRSDIKLFVQMAFDYVILDESQAIKNPLSKAAKAACLLQAKHRLCMSGTPLQNNTFDLYAQMHFLNPGMLGSLEYFRQEFAIPIDKFGEEDRKEHLKKIVYPFILRRTKEQVAKDLPEKQEMILYCEMEEEQRSIYESYRDAYRSQILGSIETRGLQKSQLTILQGLMKLRQICDSPAILNETEKFENYSVKLDELSRELMENIGEHKVLIFSQFLGMLSLIRKRMEELNIPYEYFDGSTPVAARDKAIQRFQHDEHIRVFLISLKAGGVGLNLTAADYVYIVDPWWNPAVEQQAIDRTHRIGQTKNIFAYRMICKDTIEDKILQLQEKKRNLAKDIITDEESFVKSLTKEDVEYLFS
ncbi:MAG: SNF2 family helicase [Chitinophagaceae bacterium]|nr:SNF2 family helicase [Chitinophagaceae bacterium]